MMTCNKLLCFDELKYDKRELPYKFDLQHASLCNLMRDYCTLNARMYEDDTLFVRNRMRTYAQTIIDRLSLIESVIC